MLKFASVLIRYRLLLMSAFLCLLGVGGWHYGWRYLPTASSQGKVASPIVSAAIRLPVWFEANRGQAARDVQFLARSRNASLALTAQGAKLYVRKAANTNALELKFRRARQQNKLTKLSGSEPLPGRSHYLRGNVPSRWQRDVPQFGRVLYDELYPGIDLAFYGNGQQFEYDLIVAPGADARRIEMEFAGAQHLRLNERGDLVLELPGGAIIQKAPVAYQQTAHGRQSVTARYALDQHQRVRFELGAYDRQQPLVIDPVIEYSTYLGGEGVDQGYAVTVDNDGNAYVAGTSASTSFPGPSPIQATRGGGSDVFVAKLNAIGSALVYATYLGGANDETPTALSVDANGNVIVTGYTGSPDFPLTTNAAQRTSGGGFDAFITKLDASGTALAYSTLWGGNGADLSLSLAVDATGNATFAGWTSSSNLPNLTLSGALVYQSTNRGNNWNASGNGLAGGTVNALAVDPANNNKLIAATDSGVFKTTNGGTSWMRISTLGNVTAIVIDPKNPQVHFLLGPLFTLAVTRDDGATYAGKYFSFFDATANESLCMAIDPANSRNAFVGTRAGLWRTTDGGASWLLALINTQFGTTRPQVWQVVFDPSDSKNVYAATVFNLYKSTDGGASWMPIPIQHPSIPTSVLINALVLDPKNPQTLYAAFNGANGTLFKTTNGGASWQQIANGLTYQVGGQTVPLSITDLAIDPTTPTTLYAAALNGGLFRSTDGGATWSLTRNGLNNQIIRSLAVDSAGAVQAGTLIGNDAFVARISADGTRFTQARLLGGFESDEARALGFDPAGNVVVMGTTFSNNFPTHNPWQAVNRGFSDFQPTSDAFVARLHPTTFELLASTYFGGSFGDQLRAAAIDGNGSVYLLGATVSTDWPVTLNAFQPMKSGGTDMFVTKFNPAEAGLSYSTYLGGSLDDQSNGLAVDASGQAYLTGQTNSTDFPVVNSLQPASTVSNFFGTSRDVIVAKLSANGSALLFSSYLGGGGDEVAVGLALDSKRSIYLTGGTVSSDFPVLAPAQTNRGFSVEGFLTKLTPQADLAVSNAAQHNPVMASQPYSYTATVTNLGTDEAVDARLSTTVPSGLTNVTISSSAGAMTCTAAPNVQCRLGELAMGATATVTIEGTAPATGALEHTVSVSSATVDPVTTNNRATMTATVSVSPSLAGRVTVRGGAPLPDATLMLTGSATATRQSNAAGTYQFTELVRGGTYNVAAQRAGYAIRPVTVNLPNVQTDQTANFTATLCVYNATFSQSAFSATGGNGTLSVTTPDGFCSWQARSNTAWIRLTSTPSGTGVGTVNFTVAATTVPRSGTVTVAGRTYTITQEYAPCATPNFRFAPTLAIPPNATDLLEGDFNNDRITDVALLYPAQTTPVTPAQVVVLLGNGTGGFAAPQTVGLALNTGEFTQALAVGDWNGDGRSDLVVRISTPTTDRVLIALLANAAGGFAAPRRTVLTRATNSGTIRFVAGPLNSDAFQDLAVTDESGLRFILSNGDGTFNELPVPGIGTDNFTVFSVGDFNRDNHADVVVGVFGRVVLFVGDGTGRLRNAAIAQPGSSDMGGMVVADLNRDGILEIVVSTDGQLVVVLNDGTGRLTIGGRYPATPNSRSLAARDFNNDGKLDILAVSAGNGVALYLGGNDNTLQAPAYFAAGGALNSLIVADLDRDNRPDLLLRSVDFSANPPTGLLMVLKNNGLEFQTGRSTVLNNAVADLVAGDFDNDGRQDIATLQAEQSTGSGGDGQPLPQSITVRLANGTTFSEGLKTPLNAQIDLATRDVNRDGRLDLIARDSDSLSFWLGDGKGHFQLATRLNALPPVPIPDNTSTPRVPLPYVIEDFNRDGRDDIVTFNSQRQPVLYLATGSNAFQAARSFAAGSNLSNFRTGDFNGDGNPDLLAFHPLSALCSLNGVDAALLLGDGQGGFAAARRLALPVQPAQMLVEDFNGDGRSDLAVTAGCSLNANLVLLIATPTGGFESTVIGNASTAPLGLVGGDVNNDGRKDFVLVQQSQSNAGGANRLLAFLQLPDRTYSPPNLLGLVEPLSQIELGDFTGDGLTDVVTLSQTNFNNPSLWLTLYSNQCFTTRALALASAASYSNAAFAADAMVAAFGTGLATATTVASVTPLPLELSGTRVTVTDSTLVERAARLYFVSPTQVNFLLPAGTALGAAQVKISSGDNIVSTQIIQIATVAPGLFTTNADGRGVPAAQALRVRIDGIQLYEPVAQLDRQTNRFVPLPLDFGLASDQLFLVLYGTGWRGRTSLANVTARVGGVNVPVLYAGAQNELAGLDQINLSLPRELKGRGEVDVQLTVDGQALNVVRIALR